MGYVTRNEGHPYWAALAGRSDARRRVGDPGDARLRWRAVTLWDTMADVVRDADDVRVCFMGRELLAMTAYGPPPLSATAEERRALLDAQIRWVDLDSRQLIRVGALRRIRAGGMNHNATFEVLTLPWSETAAAPSPPTQLYPLGASAQPFRSPWSTQRRALN